MILTAVISDNYIHYKLNLNIMSYFLELIYQVLRFSSVVDINVAFI